MNTLNINSIHTCTQHKIMHYITNDYTHIITGVGNFHNKILDIKWKYSRKDNYF